MLLFSLSGQLLLRFCIGTNTLDYRRAKSSPDRLAWEPSCQETGNAEAIVHDLREAMSMAKRNFTSDLSSRA